MSLLRSPVARSTFSPARRRLLQALAALPAVPLAACGGSDDAAPDVPAAGRAAPLKVAAAAQAAVAQGLVGAVYGRVDAAAPPTVAAAGLRLAGRGAALDGSELFALGSNTKALASALAAALVAQGRLRWDTRAVEVLPEAAATALPAYRNVTLADLLAHRGGVWAFTMGTDFADFGARYDGPIPDAMAERRRLFAAWLLQQPPRQGVMPGVSFSYSNAGYAVASAMLEAAAGQGFEALVQAQLLQPLGLQGTWTRPDRAGAAQPTGHAGRPGALEPFAPYDADMQMLNDVMAAAGGLSLTPAAYATWLRAHLLALRGQATVLPGSYVARLRALPDDGYDLGWMRVAANGRAVLAHLGSEDGFTALAMMDPAGTRATFAFTNGASYDGSNAVGTLLQQLALRVDAA